MSNKGVLIVEDDADILQLLAYNIDAAPLELLTTAEFKLLGELIHHPGRAQTRDQLLDTVWAYEFEGYARTVDTHVRRLRQKLGPCSDWIETVRGVGYRFKG